MSANKYSLNGEKTELVIFKVRLDEIKVNLGGKRFYPSNSEKYIALNIDRFLHWHDQVNSIAAKLNRANALLLKIRNYVNTKTLRNIYFAIFDSHLSYSCIVWAQHINAFSRLIILQKKITRNNEFQTPVILFKPIFHCKNIILKFGDKNTLENILLVNTPINKQVPSMFYDWFIFSENLNGYKTCWSSSHLNIRTFSTQKYGHFSIKASIIRSWNYTQDHFERNLLLKNSPPETIKV